MTKKLKLIKKGEDVCPECKLDLLDHTHHDKIIRCPKCKAEFSPIIEDSYEKYL